MESLIGVVPDGWAEARLGDICEILAGPSGARLTLEPRTPSNIPVITPRDLRNNRIAEDGMAAVTPGLADELSRYRLSSGDVVCSRTGDLGRQGLASERQEGWLVGTGCLRLRVRRQISAHYLTYYFGHPTVRDWITRNATGSAIPSLNTKTLGSMPVVFPPMAMQSLVTEVLGALDEKVAVHDQISRTTAKLRDALLPLLLGDSVKARLGPLGESTRAQC
ncbi:MAG: restriction endonuclease subunit S [Pseudonocardiaceae bacterium]